MTLADGGRVMSVSKLFNVWADGQAMKTTIIAASETAARNIFAGRHGWLSDERGFVAFVRKLHIEQVH